jgi:hypothetical protein
MFGPMVKIIIHYSHIFLRSVAMVTIMFFYVNYFRELFEKGAMPYGGRTNVEVCDDVLAGHRLEQPKLCPDEVYEVMKQCWSDNPKERPSMKEIEEKITSVINLQ